MISVSGYHVSEKIYESLGARVFRGTRDEDGAPVIFKILKSDYPTPAALARYRQEFEITSSLDIDGVVKVYELRKHRNSLVMILEDFGGISLRLLKERHGLDIEELTELAVEIVRILGFIHDQNVVHKDLNPSNLVYNPETKRLKIIDFGIATRLARTNPILENPNVMEGTLAYISPEQTGRMNRFLDYRTDFYSLGATLYELLCGEPPFVLKDPMELVHAHLARKPEALHKKNPEVPLDLSAVVMKLLSKTAEDRYLSAWGLEADLKECQARRLDREVSPFELGLHDVSPRFQISQKLYGRECEIHRLLNAFERVGKGESIFALVSGYAGIGKSVMIREIHKPVTRMRGYFIFGKYDQFQHLPYSAIAAAFREMVRQILAEGEQALAIWRDKLLEALGPNGQVIINVIPEVAMVIGEQPPLAKMGPTETATRLRMTFLNFVKVFCDEIPLVLFLDDLQWADLLSLELVGVLMTDETVKRLFLVGAYRDNEVGPTHPLTITINGLNQVGAPLKSIVVERLGLFDIQALIADSLRKTKEDVLELASLVMHKSGGNPFFVNQFLTTLHEEGLLVFQLPENGNAGGWKWDMAGIEAMGFTDNVVDLVLGKLRKLPHATREILKMAACAGESFDLGFLAAVREETEKDSYAVLLPAIQEGLILGVSDLEVINDALVMRSFKFLHDRVQQANYELLDKRERKTLHSKMGHLLLRQLDEKQRVCRLFEIVDHLNAGLVSEDHSVKLDMAKLNLQAARRARKASAFTAVRGYLEKGIQSLEGLENLWLSHYDLAMGLYLERSEAEYLTGHFEEAEHFLEVALKGARTPLEEVGIYSQQVVQYTMAARYTDVMEVGVRALALLGIHLPLDNPEAAIGEDLVIIAQLLHGREIAPLVNEPEASDPLWRAAIDMLTQLLTPSYLYLPHLFPMFAARQARLSLEHGPIAGSALGFGCLGIVYCTQFGQFRMGYELGLLAYRLSDRFHDPVDKSRSCLLLSGYLNPWNKHLIQSRQLAEEGMATAMACGSLMWAGYNASFKVFSMFSLGLPLPEVAAENAGFIHFGRKVGHKHFVRVMEVYRRVMANLVGKTSQSDDFNVPEGDEASFMKEIQEENDNYSHALYAVLKMIPLYLYGDYKGALELAQQAEQLSVFLTGINQSSDHCFYHALTLTAMDASLNEELQEQNRVKITELHQKLKVWAEACPENFSHRELLVKAELACISGNLDEAGRIYDQALSKAAANGFMHEEALINERAGLCWLSQDRGKVAGVYMRDAHHGYGLWGAVHKVQQLDSSFPALFGDAALEATARVSFDPSTNTGTRMLKALDLASVLKASQAISGEIVLDDLMDRMMHILLENAGGQRGFLLLERKDRWMVKVGVEMEGSKITFPNAPVEEFDDLSRPIVNYGIKTRETIVLDNASQEGRFTKDNYIVKRQPKSVLCMPVMHHGKLCCVLYMENNLAIGAFDGRRLSLLKLLSSQAAVSIVNARLYSRMEHLVQERTARLSETLEQLEEKHDQLKKTQGQLVQTGKMASLGTLTAGIAHELKNPLNFINNFSSISLELYDELRQAIEEKDGEEVQAILEDLTINGDKIHKHGVQADRIVKSMMNIARGETGERMTVVFNDHVDEYVNLTCFGSRARDDGLIIDAERYYDQNIGELEIVPQDLGRVWINLVNNATDALYEKRRALGSSFVPKISVTTENHSDHVLVKIWDNGSGISDHKMKKIFDPFYTSKPPGKGNTGLGLSISFDIVTSGHSGTLTATSLEGAFTEFVVKIPK